MPLLLLLVLLSLTTDTVGLTVAFGFVFGDYFVVKTPDFLFQHQHNDDVSFFIDASAHPMTTTTIENKLNKLYISCENYSGFSPATMG